MQGSYSGGGEAELTPHPLVHGLDGASPSLGAMREPSLEVTLHHAALRAPRRAFLDAGGFFRPMFQVWRGGEE